MGAYFPSEPVHALCCMFDINAVGCATDGCIVIDCTRMFDTGKKGPKLNLSFSREDAELLVKSIPELLKLYDAMHPKPAPPPSDN